MAGGIFGLTGFDSNVNLLARANNAPGHGGCQVSRKLKETATVMGQWRWRLVFLAHQKKFQFWGHEKFVTHLFSHLQSMKERCAWITIKTLAIRCTHITNDPCDDIVV